MKDEGSIRHKLKQVRYRHLKKRLEHNFKKLPCNCAFNETHVVRNGSAGSVGLCMYGADSPETWEGVLCDAEIEGGIEQARSCPMFTPLRTKDVVKEEFGSLMDKEPHEVAKDFPDIAALLWVLGDSEEWNLTIWDNIKLFFFREKVASAPKKLLADPREGVSKESSDG